MKNSDNKIFRVGLIGLGAVSNNHIRSLLMNPQVQIVALCDVKEERLIQKKQENALDCALYTDYKEMILRESLDTVHIMTPHYLHAPMAVYALEHALDVFLEKPIGISPSDAQSILDAEARTGKHVCVCFQNRFSLATLKAKQLLDEDGGALSGYISVAWNRDEAYYQSSDWRGFYKTEGGGVMINQAIHSLDLACQFLGTPKTLKATVHNHHLAGIIEVEDTAEGVIEFEGGKSAVFFTTTAFVGGDQTSVLFKSAKRCIEIRDGKLLVDSESVELEEEALPYFGKSCYGRGHKYLIDRFYNALATGEEMPVSAKSACDALRILLAAYRSNGEHTKI